jgi:hypothetical protein
MLPTCLHVCILGSDACVVAANSAPSKETKERTGKATWSSGGRQKEQIYTGEARAESKCASLHGELRCDGGQEGGEGQWACIPANNPVSETRLIINLGTWLYVWKYSTGYM